MSDALFATDRLPWLSDQAPATVAAKRGLSSAAIFVAGAASAAILFGGVTLIQERNSQAPAPAVSAQTVPLPRPQAAPAVAQSEPQPLSASEREALSLEAASVPQGPEAKPARQAKTPPRRRNSAPVSRNQAVEAPQASAVASPSAPVPVAAPAVAPAVQPRQLWPSRQAAGAGGRLVQIGAFATRRQAKLGWRRMQRSYPAVGTLPAVVVDARNSKGRKFYRFQIGTTSHAHSEVLCQRMQRIDYSCAVIGLAWKAKIER